MLRKGAIALPFRCDYALVNGALLSLMVIFAFLGGINFLNYQGAMFLLSCFFGLLWTVLRGKIYIDGAFVLTLVFSVSYLVCNGVHNGFAINDIIASLVLFPSLYQIGRALSDYKHGFDILWAVVVTAAIGFFLHSLLTIYETIKYEGLHFNEHLVHSFWVKGGLFLRNGLSFYQLPLLALLIPMVIFPTKYRRPWVIASAVLLFLFCVWAEATVGNRAIFVVWALLALFWGVVFFFVLKKVKYRIIYCSIVAVLLAVLVVSMLGYGPLGPYLSSINVIERFIRGGSNNTRIKLYVIFFQNFIYYPFGGMNALFGNDGYVHNLLLDFYTFGGILPFMCAIAFFARFIEQVVWAKQNKMFSNIRYIAIISVVCSIYAIGLFEPIYQASRYSLLIPYLFFAYNEGAFEEENPMLEFDTGLPTREGY